MSKRAAEVQLSADAPEDDTPEEAGEFEVASEQQLQQRVIKKAVRGRTTQMQQSTTGLFSGVRLTMNKPNGSTQSSAGAPTVTMTTQGSNSTLNNTYLQQLRSLNVSVSEWIGQHVTDNPFVDLTPIFRDYESHLKTIDTKYKTQSSVIPPAATSLQKDDITASQGSSVTSSQEEEDTATADSKATSSDSDSAGDGESVTEEHPPSDSQASQSAVTSASEAEDDALFSTRAKLFYKKEAEYVEMGVGTLTVSKGNPTGFRLLLRNDTKLRNILLNVRVTPDIPVSVSKKNVFVVCLPNPPLTQDRTIPVTYLIRVKTEELASQLAASVREK